MAKTKKKAPPRPSTPAKSSKKSGKKKSSKKSGKKKSKRTPVGAGVSAALNAPVAGKKSGKKSSKKSSKKPARKRKAQRGRQPALVLTSGNLDAGRVRSMLAKADRLTVELKGSATAWMPGEDTAEAPGIVVYTKDGADTVAKKRAKQGARMLKVICPKCGYNLRTTHKWLELAIPECPMGHGTMDAPDVETE